MGRHHGIGPHYYRGLDEGKEYSQLKIEISLRELAEKVESMNYGAHRFLSHLIDVRRERNEARWQTYRDRGDHDIADSAEKEGDLLVEGLEALLKAGGY